MEILLILASVTAASVRSLLSKKLSKSTGNLHSFGRVNALMSLTALAIICVYSAMQGIPGISAASVLLAILYAGFTFAAQLFYMCALNTGDVAAVTFFYSCGFVIPAFAGALLFGETLGLRRIVGVAILILAFRLNAAKKAAAKPRKRGWLLPALLAMTASGIIGLIQKLHQSSDTRAELGGFLVIAFAVCTGMSLLLGLFAKPDGEAKPIRLRECLPAVICGSCIGAANLINTQLSGVLPAMILFPALNGGTVIASALAARIFCGEALTRRQTTALCIGIAAIILIAK